MSLEDIPSSLLIIISDYCDYEDSGSPEAEILALHSSKMKSYNREKKLIRKYHSKTPSLLTASTENYLHLVNNYLNKGHFSSSYLERCLYRSLECGNLDVYRLLSKRASSFKCISLAAKNNLSEILETLIQNPESLEVAAKHSSIRCSEVIISKAKSFGSLPYISHLLERSITHI